MAAHGGEPKIRHKIMANGVAENSGNGGLPKKYTYMYKKKHAEKLQI